MEHAVRTLVGIDWIVILGYAALSLTLGIWHTRKASTSVNEFFLSGRSMPWWLLGVSMAATNFSIDTPLAITKYVFQEGVGGVWFFWAFAMTGIIATFVFAKMWRRSEVMTDAEIIERRYSGKVAAALRVFKGCYFGIFINSFVMGWMLRAVVKVMGGLTNVDPTIIMVCAMVLVLVYVFASGFYGVVLTDFIQYMFAIAGSFLLAFYSVRDVGGLQTMVDRIQTEFGVQSGVTNFVPNLSDSAWMPLSVFLVYVCIQWWAQKYSDGGGKRIQRMCSAKNEKHAVFATFFFTIMNYAVQTWPWITVALCAILIYGRDVSDPEMTYVWMMGRQLPAGVLGIMVVTLLSAFMGSISAHLNLGGSYMINDLYRRHLVKHASEKHYVIMSRVAMIVIFVIAMLVAFQIKSIGSAWKLVLEFTSGAGLTFVIRWFWWRPSAWTEFSGMITSALVTLYMELWHAEATYATKILTVVGISTAVWLFVTLITKPVDENRLAEFVRKVRPGMPGWKRIYRLNDIPYVPYWRDMLVNVVLGVVFFLSTNFGIGSFVLGKYKLGVVLAVTAVVSCTTILYRVTREMNGKTERKAIMLLNPRRAISTTPATAEA